MTELADIAPTFVSIAHRIVWCSVATVDGRDRPRNRVLHPIWEWDGERLVGWIATEPTSAKAAHLARSPYVSCSYWDPTQDVTVAECRAIWEPELAARDALWQRFLDAPEPVRYDPRIIPQWTAPDVGAFGSLRLEPWRLKVHPAADLMQGIPARTWRAPGS